MQHIIMLPLQCLDITISATNLHLHSVEEAKVQQFYMRHMEYVNDAYDMLWILGRNYNLHSFATSITSSTLIKLGMHSSQQVLDCQVTS